MCFLKKMFSFMELTKSSNNGPLSASSRKYQEINVATANFYGTVSVAAMVIHLSVMMAYYGESISVLNISMNILLCVLYITSYQTLRYVSQVEYIDGGDFCFVGNSNNTTGLMPKHLKHIITLCSATQVAALLSDYFWLFLLALPLRLGWLVYYNVTYEERKRRKLHCKLSNLGIE